MRPKQIKAFIIGAVIFGLTLQAPLAHALYSPTLTKKVGEIRQHVMASRENNGAGTLMNVIDKVVKQDAANQKAGKATGIFYKAAKAILFLSQDTITDLISPCDAQQCYALVPYVASIDPIFMILFDVVWSTATRASSCLRDDIFTLEAMKDAVAEELVKAYLLYDSVNGDLLWKDYNFLRNHAAFLKAYGERSAMPMPESVFDYRVADVGPAPPYIPCETCEGGMRMPNALEFYFPATKGKEESGVNYYAGVNCTGEWLPALEQVGRSAETFWTLFTAGGQSWEWSNIIDMAKARAQRRANEWIRNNAITLTIAGSGSATGQPLLTGTEVLNSIKAGEWGSPSLDRFAGNWATQGKIFMDLVPILPHVFDKELYLTIADVARVMAAGAAYAGTAGTVDSETIKTIVGDAFPQSKCAYWNAHDGVFWPCNKEQLKLFEEKQCYLCYDITDLKTPLEAVASARKIETKNADAKKAAEKTFQYNFVLNTIGESNIMDLDLALFETNMVIKRAYEQAGTGEKSLPTFCGQLIFISKNQCKNKGGLNDAPACK